MKILAIETSCDETSIAILEANENDDFKIISNIVSSQVAIHAPFGGVVPMLAKREHQKNLVPVLKEALFKSRLLKEKLRKLLPEQANEVSTSKANYPSTSAAYGGFRSGNNLQEILEREPELLKKLLPFLKKYQKPNIDLITVTNGPGLEPALWVGVNFAKALGYFWGLPVIPINHVEAHIIANWLTQNKIPPNLPLKREKTPSFLKEGWGGFNTSRQSLIAIRFPAISLIVSGGHTQLVLMRGFGQYKILGETRDDAAGEAFDKLAKMLNLGYPGGPIISRLAEKFNIQYPKNNIQTNAKSLPTSLFKGRSAPSFLKEGWLCPSEALCEGGGGFSPPIKFPRPMINSGDYDFSFSGLKTAALYFIKTLSSAQLKKLTPAICAEFQQAAIDVLVSKTIHAAKEFGVKTVLLSGGVAANDLLRETLKLEAYNLKLNFSVPPKNFCTDNAAMIALTAYLNQKLKIKNKKYILKIKKINWQKIQADANLRLS